MSTLLSSKSLRRRGAAYIALLIVSLLLLTVSSNPLVRDLQHGVAFAFKPFQVAVDGVAADVRSIVDTIAEIDQLRQENALLQAVTSGRAACAALTNISLNDVVSKNPGAGVEVTSGFFPVVDGKEVISAGAFVFRPGENDILEAFNTELTALHQSGEWLRIVEPFGFTQDNLPGPEVTTESLCSA